MRVHDVTLRQAVASDLYFLFIVSTLGMLPVRKARNPELRIDVEQEFKEYKERFDPPAIQVIMYRGVDAGRLRAVRSPEQLYIGGIQVLEEFQGLGIGTAVIRQLLDEARSLSIPVTLEVSIYNERAQRLYERLGFTVTRQVDTCFHMECHSV